MAGWAVSPRWAVAAAPRPTPAQPLGPFYPFYKPADQDNDLATVDGAPSGAHGRLLHLAGRVIDVEGRDVVGATVEIWHNNSFGRYHNPEDRRDVPTDPGFQGFGSAMTGPDGGYEFRTIRPQAYPASLMWTRPAHVHFHIAAPGYKRFVTQMYFAGDPHLAADHLLNGVRDPRDRQRLIVTPRAAPPSLGEDADLAHFDIVLPAPA